MPGLSSPAKPRDPNNKCVHTMSPLLCHLCNVNNTHVRKQYANYRKPTGYKSVRTRVIRDSEHIPNRLSRSSVWLM